MGTLFRCATEWLIDEISLAALRGPGLRLVAHDVPRLKAKSLDCDSQDIVGAAEPAKSLLFTDLELRRS